MGARSQAHHLPVGVSVHGGARDVDAGTEEPHFLVWSEAEKLRVVDLAEQADGTACQGVRSWGSGGDE